ncbi:MAG TPA: NAD(P)H-hydrate dehydratase [Nocardioidaceae bacterium]|nr:NAD(P)H-hydrate dehydratase [Nocardioidaceae bacterium]
MTATEVDRALLEAWPLPDPGEHKNARGVVGIAGGSRTTPGAARLAAEAAFRVGAGKVRIATGTTCAPALAVSLPEAAVAGFPEGASGDLSATASREVAEFLGRSDVVLLGSGLVDPSEAAQLVARLVDELDAAVVIDGVGTAYVNDHRSDLHRRDTRGVLTMNPNELAHIVSTSAQQAAEESEQLSADLARETGCVVVCGGRQKVVATPEGGRYVVRGGGPGLAVSGSGDVLAGLVSGLYARCEEPSQAAVWAAWLHARAGDELARTVGEVGFLARELPRETLRLLASF